MTRMAQVERDQLCDVALQVGEDQPTLCGDWDVKDLVVHLLVRERSPAAVGIVVKPLSGLIDLESRRLGAQPFHRLVERVRQGPPVWTPQAVPKVDKVLNTLEFFVHHEDIRRAQPDWEPRDLPLQHEKLLWAMIRKAGRTFTRKTPVGVRIENSVTGSTVELHEGEPSVTVRGLPSEVTLFLFGRQQQARVELVGPDDAAEQLRHASFGA